MHYWTFEYVIIRGPCLENTITKVIFVFSGSFHERPEAKWGSNPLDLYSFSNFECLFMFRMLHLLGQK